ncbi:hypothetical protein [Brevibacterium casei]|uniref:hypothetical protein n=1 Tax=Brevibacterium casei TaxID=33889 RepID=UPI0028AECD09|nr:hypothetical protein [Brevibacterium casei]
MSDVIGRAGFHAQHTKDVSERSAIIHEMMRELDEDSIAYWASRNPNIVVADEVFNEAMVNDGEGGFRACTRRQEVLDYGAGRVGRVKRKFREDKLDPKTGKMKGGTVTTSLLVSHLPKSMCVEVPDFYPVLDKSTGDPVLDDEGVPLKRSRWVARDRDEARRYFEDVVAYLAGNVIPGGADAVLGYDIQHSESTPHVQIVADTFAPDPKNEGGLRVESSQAWFSHRDVRDENGKQKSGPMKLSEYHAGLKEHLLDRGYDISADFDEERHLVGMGKDEYGKSMDARREALDRNRSTNQQITGFKTEVAEVKRDFENRQTRLDEREGILDRREAEIPALRRRAIKEGTDEGKRRGYAFGIDEARDRTDEAMKTFKAQLWQSVPQLLDEFRTRKDPKGRSYQPIFDKFVDKKLKQFEVEHGVAGRLELHPGDREQFIQDGGEYLAAEVTQLQSERTYGD